MPNNEQYNALMEGTKIWNEWRRLYEDAVIDLSGADLKGESIKGNNLSNVDLSGANIRKVNAVGTDFRQANLKQTDLSNTNARKANFSGADLSGVNASHANLFGANFTDANLSGANLNNAEIEAAVGLTQAQVNQAIGNDHTGLPEGIQRPENWAVTDESE